MNQEFKIPPHELTKFKERLNQKRCFFPNCDSQKIIKAHSIQENGPLATIADEINGQTEVYYLDDEFTFDKTSESMVSKQGIKRLLHHRGIGTASTFNGFCGVHDKIFQNTIEDTLYTNTLQQQFLFTYRAYAYHMHKRYELLKMTSNLGNELSNDISKVKIDQKIPENNPFSELAKSLNSVMDGLSGVMSGLEKTFDAVNKISEQELFGLNLKKQRLDDIIEKYPHGVGSLLTLDFFAYRQELV